MRRHIPLLVVVLLALTVTPELVEGQRPISFEYISRIAWSPDSTRIALAKVSRMGGCLLDDLVPCAIPIFEPETGAIIQELVGHHSRTVDVSWSSDGTRIASSDTGGKFFVWDVSTNEWISSPRLLPPGGGSVFWNPAGTLIATIVAGGEYATIWDAVTGEILYDTLPGHEEPTSGVAWSPDGSQIATSGLDDTIRIYDTTHWVEIAVLEHPDSVYWVAWSPDEAIIASGLRDGTIHLWDASSRESLRVLEGHPAAVERVVWSPDSTRIASSGGDGMIRFWNVATGDQLESLQSTQGAIVDIAWSPDGTRLAYVGEQSDLPEIITPPQLPAASPPDEARIVAVEAIPAALADGDYVTVWDDGVIEVWDFDAQEPRRIFSIGLPRDYDYPYEIRTTTLSPDGMRLAIGYGVERWFGIVQIVDLQTGALLAHITDPLADIQDLDWSPDGTQLTATAVSGSFDSTFCYLYIIDAVTGEVTLEHLLPSAAGAWVDWSPLGDQIGVTHAARLILWDVAQQQPAVTFPTAGALVVWSPDGHQMAILASEIVDERVVDTMIQVVDAQTGQIVRTHTVDPGDNILTRSELVWNHGGDYLVLNTGQRLFFWNPRTDRVTVNSFDRYVRDIALTEANTLIYVYGSDEIRTVDLSSIAPAS